MIRSRNRHFEESSGTDESEALQADVMRFMAILGLCLMVIFALVQSMPSGLPEAADTGEVSAEKTRALKALDAALRAREKELRALSERVSVDAAEVERLQTVREANEKAAIQAQALRDEVLAEVRQKRSELEAMKGRLAQARQRPEREVVAPQQRVPTSVPKVAAVPLPQTLVRSSEKLAARKSVLQQGSSPKEDLHARRQQALMQARALAEQRQRRTSSPVEKKGFHLRFASDDALLALAGRNEVSVYLKARRKGWRLDVGQMRFVEQKLPGSFHQMAAETVSVALRTVAEKVADQTMATWRVVLSERIQGQIQHRMRGHQGGELVIDADGTVILKG